MWFKLVFLSLILVLGGCSSVTHYESTTVARTDKHDGGVSAIRRLQRSDQQQCDISVAKKTPDIKDLNSEIWAVLICKKYYQYQVRFEPQAEDRYKVTATRFVDP